MQVASPIMAQQTREKDGHFVISLPLLPEWRLEPRPPAEQVSASPAPGQGLGWALGAPPPAEHISASSAPGQGLGWVLGAAPPTEHVSASAAVNPFRSSLLSDPSTPLLCIQQTRNKCSLHRPAGIVSDNLGTF